MSAQREIKGIGREAQIYTARFSEEQEKLRSITWKILCRDFLQLYVSPSSTVVDLGAGDGHFLRNITAKEKIAVDLSPHVLALEKEGVKVLNVPATEFSTLLKNPVDVIFASNFFEHLPDKRTLLDVIEQANKSLVFNGRLLVLQPNIRYARAKYWDYIDHHIALTEHSLVEALEICGFEIKRLIPRFLPFTAKSKVGTLASIFGESLITVYLKFPFLWRLFGEQTFVYAVKSTELKQEKQ